MIDVLIDAQTLGDPDSVNRGFGRYVSALVASLPEAAGLTFSALALPGTVLPADVRPVLMQRFARPGRWSWEQHIARLGLDIKRARPDVFHSPRTEPPLWCGVPWVQTLHDLIGMLYVHDLFAAERRRWRLRAPLMRRADAVIAISRFTADLGIEHLGLRPDRVEVIYHGVTPIFRPPGPAIDAPERPFLLYVSEYAAHKGYAEAFEVAARVAEAGHPHVLKVVGGFNPFNRPIVEALHQTARRPERVELLGFVADDDLVELYQQATALVVTSRQEGFGRPVIEAIACGTPVISFDNTALPEIVGDAGVVVADGDVGAFVSAVLQVLSHSELLGELESRALERAGVFSWDRCAAEHTEVYRAVAG